MERPANVSPGVPLHRGVRAVKAILDKGVEGLVLRHMGDYEFKLAQGKARLYAFEGRAEDAISMIANGDLREATAPTEIEGGPRGMGRRGGCGEGGHGEGWGQGEGQGHDLIKIASACADCYELSDIAFSKVGPRRFELQSRGPKPRSLPC